MDFKKASKIRIVLSLIALVLVIIAAIIKNPILAIIGGVLLIVSSIIWMAKGKCPHCGRYIGKYLNECCPRCGGKLLDKDK